MQEQKKILVTPTPGTSFDRDMAQRDEAAEALEQMLALGATVTVQLHANLDDAEIRLAVKRWKNRNVAFLLAENDSTAKERERFVKRWKAAGGSGL